MSTQVAEAVTTYPYFTEEHDLIRQTVKRFCREEIAPHAEEWDEKGDFPTRNIPEGRQALRSVRHPRGPSTRRQRTRLVGQRGLYGVHVVLSDSPGVNMALMVQSDLAVPFLAEMGTTEQQGNEFMKPAISGEKIAALGISEPGGGSDVANLRCTARLVGDEFVINGQKLWITNGTRCDFILLAVSTGEDGHRGISFVTFPTDVKGYSVGKKLKKVGNLASDTAELFFDDCRIPARYLVGEKNRGFYYVMENFQGERLAASIMQVAMMDRALECAIQYGHERLAFGKPIGSNQVWKTIASRS